MKIKYVGVKPDGETAFAHQTGITWMPGDSHEITDLALCKRMLQHPDVFAKDFAQKPPVAEQLSETAAGPVITLPDGTMKDLAGLDKEELHALAKQCGVTMHHAAGVPKITEALLAAFANPVA